MRRPLNVMLPPLEVPFAVLCGDREVFLFSVKLADVPGALQQVFSVMASYGVNVVSIYSVDTSYLGEREQVEVNIIVDLTGKPYSAEQLAKSISLLNVVKDVSYYGKQLPDMLFDEHHFPMRMMGERAIIYRESGYREMILGLKRQLGTGGDALLYHIGLNIGKGIWNKLKQITGGDIDLLVKHVKYRVMMNRTSMVREIILEAGRVVVRLEDNYECALVKNYGKPFSNLHRGMFAGIFSELVGSDNSKETKCIAAGDPYCEFVIGRTD
ncbi:MAG: V4R domain-containing protein [Candidatus Caldarchaeum sp.]|uniref:ACT domain-containing protein n=1 Tax=Caldiarchaeum subterraneum TaxID=311458 RepID=A0A7J3VU37_CALS0